MREPKMLRNPNGGLLSVDVTLLQLGLSRCRCIAEDALVRLDRGGGDAPNIEAVLNEILDESRKTLRGIEDNDLQDEVGALLRATDATQN